MYLTHLIIPSAITVALFVVALGLGRAVFRAARPRFASPLGFNLFALAAGMAAISHVTVLLGLFGAWRTWALPAAWAVLAVVALAGFVPALRAVSRHEKRHPRLSTADILALGALALIVACMALRATLPSANYDVLEYHVGAVRHWLRQGKIVPFRHLFYAALPFEVEMWYAAGCFLEGNPLLPASPKLINFGLLAANLVAVYALAGALGLRRRSGLLACLLLAVHPLTAIVAFDALNDLGLTLYATLAALAWVGWAERCDRLDLALWALMLGLAVCCKYTAIGLVALPGAIILAPVGLARGHDQTRRPGDRQAGRLAAVGAFSTKLALVWVVLAAIGLAVFLPWAAKNLLHFGNPVYPMLSGIFPSPTWSPEQTSFYLLAHGRTDPLDGAYWSALAANIGRLGPWLVAAAVAACLIPARGRAIAAALGSAAALGLAIHSFFPGNPARFMLPFVPVAVVLATRFVEQIGHPVLRSAAVAPFVLWIGLGLLAAFDPMKAATPAAALGGIGFPVFAHGLPARDMVANLFSSRSRLSILAEALGPKVVESQRFINERTPPDSRILLIYEARIGCFDRPIEAGSVFDRSPLLERAIGLSSGEQLLERLRREGFDYIYVNEFELVRIIRAYGPRAAYRKRLAAWGEPDVREADLWLDLYPPYYLDDRFERHRAVIEQFLAICRKRAVYSAWPDAPSGIWIAHLGGGGQAGDPESNP